MRAKITCLAVAMTLVAGRAAAQDPMVSFNPYSVLTNKQFGASAIGWYYTPTSSFFLTGIKTRFNDYLPSDDRTVTVELWSDRSALGGSLLRSGTFSSSSALGDWGGADFSSFWLEAGTTYFFGFRNVGGLGRNSTDDAGSQSTGNLWFSLGDPNQATYESLQNVSMVYNPTFQLDGLSRDVASTVTPEPVSMVLMATGLIGLAAASVIRRRRKTAVDA